MRWRGSLVVCEIYSSVVAGNSGSDLGGVASSFKSDGYNIIGTGSGVGAFNQPGDQVGVTNPMLGPLSDNGGVLLPDGSHILTHALLAGSPAINEGDLNAVAGVNGVPQYDERGTPFTRVFNGRIDIGAFEYQQPSDLNLVVDTLVDESDGNFGHGDLSLREAIELANKYPGPNAPTVINTIHFDPALTANGPATILLTMGDLKITHGVNIVGPGANLLTIDASGDDPTPDINDGKGSHVFSVSGPTATSLMNVFISGLTLTGGDASLGGAITANFANLTFSTVTIAGNASSSSGGGIYATGSNLFVVGSKISDNVATLSRSAGGAIYLTNSRAQLNQVLQIRDTEISNNQSAVSGGGIAVGFAGGTVDIENSQVFGNTLSVPGGAGGGIYIQSTGLPISVTISGSSIHDNAVGSGGRGGGLFLMGATATIADSHFDSNLRRKFGGRNLFSKCKLQSTNEFFHCR